MSRMTEDTLAEIERKASGDTPEWPSVDEWKSCLVELRRARLREDVLEEEVKAVNAGANDLVQKLQTFKNAAALQPRGRVDGEAWAEEHAPGDGADWLVGIQFVCDSPDHAKDVKTFLNSIAVMVTR